VRLEFFLVNKEVSEKEFKTAILKGSDDELFDDFFYFYCWGNTHSVIITNNKTIIDKIVPWFFRRPFSSETIEKNMTSDRFFLDKVRPLLTSGVHFNEYKIIRELDDEKKEKSKNINCMVGIDYLQNKFPLNWREENTKVDSFTYDCNEKGILHFQKNKKVDLKYYKEDVGGLYKPYRSKLFIIFNLLFLISIGAALAVKGKFHYPLIILALILFHMDMILVFLSYKKYSSKKSIEFEKIDIEVKEETTVVTGKIINNSNKYLEGMFLKFNLLDDKNEIVTSKLELIHKVNPKDSGEIKIVFEEKTKTGKSIEIVF
jgi:hypothetical protein